MVGVEGRWFTKRASAADAAETTMVHNLPRRGFLKAVTASVSTDNTGPVRCTMNVSARPGFQEDWGLHLKEGWVSRAGDFEINNLSWIGKVPLRDNLRCTASFRNDSGADVNVKFDVVVEP